MIQSQIFANLGLDLSALTQASLLELLVKNKQQQQQQQQQQILQQAQDQINNNASQQNANRYKTELCRSFQENGMCKYGEKCQFAHGYTEMRNMVRHPKYKTELCRTFHATGYCPYGPRCHFVHDTNEAGKQQQQKENKPSARSPIGPNMMCSSSSSSSSQSVSPQQQQHHHQPIQRASFDMDLLNLKIQQQEAEFKQNKASTNSLLMVASESQQSSGKSTRLNSVDSIFSIYDNVSPSSSRSLSPDAFLHQQQQSVQPQQQQTQLNDFNHFSTTNDLFYSMLNQRSYAATNNTATSSISSSLSSTSSTYSNQFNDFGSNSNQDLLVNQILNQIYLNSSI